MRFSYRDVQHQTRSLCAPRSVYKISIVKESGRLLLMIAITAISVAAIMFVMHLAGFAPN